MRPKQKKKYESFDSAEETGLRHKRYNNNDAHPDKIRLIKYHSKVIIKRFVKCCLPFFCVCVVCVSRISTLTMFSFIVKININYHSN
jgi:hypothetical protein